MVKSPAESTLKRLVPEPLLNLRKFPAKETVDEALIRSPTVPVALTWNKAPLSSEAVVEAPTPNDLIPEEVAKRKSPPETRSKVRPKLLALARIKSSPEQERPAPATSEQSKMRALAERSRPSPTSSLKVSPPKVNSEEMEKLVLVALVEVELPVMFKSPVTVEEAAEI